MLVDGFWGGLVSEDVVDQHIDVFGDIAEDQGEEAAYHRLLFAEVDQVEFVCSSDSGRDGRYESYQGDESEEYPEPDAGDQPGEEQGVRDPDRGNDDSRFPFDRVEIPFEEEPVDPPEQSVRQSSHCLPQNTIHLAVKWKVTR